MPSKDPSREAHFPLIEKKYGEPMKYWFKVMATIKDQKYPEQIAHLRENFGFSQAHANALVMFTRGSTTTRKFETHSDYFKSIDPIQAKTLRKIFRVLKLKFPDLEHVTAWNQPMLRKGTQYVFGASVTKNYILIAPFNADVLIKMKADLKDYKVNKKTVAVPSDWKVDEKLLIKMVKSVLSQK
ncbi:MAG: DUF4287 domain-containing protein [Actinobacteria bacterium]|nr:DUF4287 domain-containing protein [Actinomycetota bacterium]NDI07708.1 DUF4287 domain-containing protein [Actinomycetota bacterium]